jgi:putative heme-binding domain-containing protein
MKPVNIHIALPVALAFLAFGCVNAQKEEDKHEEVTGISQADSLMLSQLYDEHVRTTEYQTPEEERLSFILPPGFEVTLFAAEPDITKPINMAFDERGRLWVSQSSEYPIAAGPGEGNDRITILEDTDGDGRADKINDFTNDLNIPIGIMPIKGGAIGYSIPNVYRFIDSDDDGRADKREVLLGEFGHEDTHGMVNNLIRGFDGWIHASHGYTNISVVAGKDGDSVRMVSGNTFRFRQDGSRVEKTTDGRINPFGSDFDEMGYHYSADCHTLPIFQLIWDGNYEQWGKKEPNIGFAPSMMDYGLNSTALAGLVYYTDTQFPAQYQNSFYSGDVVTCRISRNTMEYNGSTPKATRQEDFLISKDPWFRPVDIKIGPDGAMYVADFYNRIIGHYEVPLSHPGRDRVSGRIWKITYKGQTRKVTDWSTASQAALIAGMGHEVLATRMMATDELVDRIGAKAVPALVNLIRKSGTDPVQLIQGIWALYRLDALPDEVLHAAVNHSDVRVKVHAYKVLANYPRLTEEQKAQAVSDLDHNNPHIQRAAAEVLGRHPEPASLKRLISLESRIPDYDTHLRYTVLLSIRKHLEQEDIMQLAALEKWVRQEAALLAHVASDVQSAAAGSYLLQYVKNAELPIGQLAPHIASVARSVPESALNPFIDFAINRAADNLEQQFLVARALNQGITQRGGRSSKALQQWTLAVAGKILAAVPADTAAWVPEMNARQQYAAEIAGREKAASLVPGLKQLLQAKSAAEGTRQTAAIALMDIAPEQHAAFIYSILIDGEEVPRMRQKLARALEPTETAQVRKLLVQALEDAPYELQSTIASILAKSTEGKTGLFTSIRQGHAPARLLKALQVEEKFLANITPKQLEEYKALTANVLPVSVERQRLIDQRIAEFNAHGKTPAMGKAVFSRNCSMCHQVNKDGGMIGPQLDGIGNWGKVALATKILDPNRNISENFRNYNITLQDGKTISGLYRREEGQLLILANSSGEEFSVNQQDIKQKEASRQTLMPDNFNSTIPKDDFDALMVYLLSIK